MKKLILYTILVGSCFTAHAQLGIRGGATLASVASTNGNASSQIDPTLGGNFGIVNSFGSGKFKFKTGLLFTQKGYQVAGLNGPTKLRINYVDIPLNLSLNLTEKFQVEAGPYLGVGVNAFSKVNSTKTNIDFQSNGLQRFDAGLNAGVNYSVAPRVQLGLYYNFGLFDISGSSNSSLTNRYAGLGVTYLLSKE